jgi:hypothetical protein
MKKKIFITIVLLCFLLLITVVIFLSNRNEKKGSEVCFKDNCFDVELAINPESRSRGLMFREKLDPDKGMLFIFEKEGNYSFWMKNTFIPLDIIWINENKKVVFIANNAQPCKDSVCPMIVPNESARYVLEINSGISEKIGLSAGTKIDFEVKK